MLEKIIDAFITKPQRLILLGALLVRGSAFAGIAGLVGRVATKATAAVAGLGSVAPQDLALRDLYPSLPTWWIPESPAGAVFTLLVLSVGVWLQLTGKQIDRYIR